MAIPVPYYEFKKQTRSVREWTAILNACSKVVAAAESNFDNPVSQIRLRVDWLSKALSHYVSSAGFCRRFKYKDASVQHDCVNYKSFIDGFPQFPYLSGPAGSVNHPAWFQARYRFFEPGLGDYTGQIGGHAPSAEKANFTSNLTKGLVTEPIEAVFNSSTVSTITAMLWPDSGDFEDSNAKPFIDLAEAVSDGKFPLGEVPDAKETYKRMSSAYKNKGLAHAITESIDFGANLWLWSTLVIEPVVSSAVALSSSVQANDDAIEGYNRKAENDEWIKGKSIRLFKDRYNCFAPDPIEPLTIEKSYETPSNLGYIGTYGSSFFRINPSKIKNEANAMIVYRLGSLNGNLLKSSGMQLGQFFNRLSSSIDTVFHNLLPLSFVGDWFTSRFTGVLDLKDKVYMPVAEYKIIVSYKFDLSLEVEARGFMRSTQINRYYRRYTYMPWVFFRGPEWISYAGNLPVEYYLRPMYYKAVLADQHEVKVNDLYLETHTYYKRQVYINPERRVNFDDGLQITCFEYTKEDPLNTGKSITLGALLWGALN
jgi:hypothetical protein